MSSLFWFLCGYELGSSDDEEKEGGIYFSEANLKKLRKWAIRGLIAFVIFVIVLVCVVCHLYNSSIPKK